MNPNGTQYLRESDLTYLKTLTDPKTPFLDIVRAMYRANRLLAKLAQHIVREELENLKECFRLGEVLNSYDVHLDIGPKVNDAGAWDYEGCWVGARIWLRDPVQATFWLFIEFGDNGIRLVTGLDFPRLNARNCWLHSCRERPEFTEVSWDGYALEQAAPLDDMADVEETLANLLQDFLTEVRRVRRAAGET